MIKLRLVCDSCGGPIADGSLSASQLRFQARALYRRGEYNKDYCLICAAHGCDPASVPQEARERSPAADRAAPHP